MARNVFWDMCSEEPHNTNSEAPCFDSDDKSRVAAAITLGDSSKTRPNGLKTELRRSFSKSSLWDTYNGRQTHIAKNTRLNPISREDTRICTYELSISPQV